MVGKIWKRVHHSFADPAAAAFWASPLKKNCNQKQKYNHDEVQEAIL
jgi:hypothetical protein